MEKAKGKKTGGHVCGRCGKCCHTGGSFWAYSEHELVRAAVARLHGDFYKRDGKCDMLVVAANGRASCLLQKWLGYNAKPKACRDYPFDGVPCFRDSEK